MDKCPESFLPTCREAFKEQRFPLYLFGLPGRGKTCAAACLYRLLPAEWKVLWFRAADFMHLIAKCRREGSIHIEGATASVTEEHLWRTRCEQVDVLFIDDIGIRAPTDAQYEMLFRLIDSRGEKPTVYTGNLSPKEVEATFDGRISSRLLRGTAINFASQIDKRTLNRKGVRI